LSANCHSGTPIAWCRYGAPRNPGEPAYFTSGQDYRDWVHGSSSVEEIAGFTWRPSTLKAIVPVRVLTQAVTSNLFTMLGASAAYGRVFSTADRGSSSSAVCSPSYGILGGRPNTTPTGQS
jgi:hypothetical protein